jgi:g-D-glutamyl-meso-diaminopimelate peptidase
MRKSGTTQTIIIVLVLMALVLIVRMSMLGAQPKPAQEVITAPIENTHVVIQNWEVIGNSVEGRDIKNYHYGTGATHLVFVGGIHGGYEWNSVLLAYTFMDYLDKHPEFIPKNITIDVIPSANPDAVYKVTNKEGRFTESDVTTDQKVLTTARFNANSVDLNRNFDCTWKPKSTWQSKVVSAGTRAFSEPEARAIKNFMLEHHPAAVVFWHSKADGVYASQCEKGILPETLAIMSTYAKASGYPGIKVFGAYETTGAADDWLASVGIPAVTVELKTHDDIEWDENFAGIKALIGHYGK